MGQYDPGRELVGEVVDWLAAAVAGALCSPSIREITEILMDAWQKSWTVSTRVATCVSEPICHGFFDVSCSAVSGKVLAKIRCGPDCYVGWLKFELAKQSACPFQLLQLIS